MTCQPPSCFFFFARLSSLFSSPSHHSTSLFLLCSFTLERRDRMRKKMNGVNSLELPSSSVRYPSESYRFGVGPIGHIDQDVGNTPLLSDFAFDDDFNVLVDDYSPIRSSPRKIDSAYRNQRQPKNSQKSLNSYALLQEQAVPEKLASTDSIGKESDLRKKKRSRGWFPYGSFLEKLFTRWYGTAKPIERSIPLCGEECRRDDKNPFPRNVVCNQKYTILTFLPKALYEEFRFFFNLYFLLVALSQLIPVLQIGFMVTYLGPLVFVVSISLMKEAIDDFHRFQRDREANRLFSMSLDSHSRSRSLLFSLSPSLMFDFPTVNCTFAYFLMGPLLSFLRTPFVWGM
jgi:hypothetical protein